MYRNCAPQSCCQIPVPRGPQGATGATGATGSNGPAGPQGPTGPAGTTFEQLRSHFTGNTGETAEFFNTGPLGNMGIPFVPQITSYPFPLGLVQVYPNPWNVNIPFRVMTSYIIYNQRSSVDPWSAYFTIQVLDTSTIVPGYPIRLVLPAAASMNSINIDSTVQIGTGTITNGVDLWTVSIMQAWYERYFIQTDDCNYATMIVSNRGSAPFFGTDDGDVLRPGSLITVNLNYTGFAFKAPVARAIGDEAETEESERTFARPAVAEATPFWPKDYQLDVVDGHLVPPS